MNMHVTNLHTNYLFSSTLLFIANLEPTYHLPNYLHAKITNHKPTYHQLTFLSPTYLHVIYVPTYLRTSYQPLNLPITNLPTNLFLVFILIQCCHFYHLLHTYPPIYFWSLFLYNVVTCATWIYKGLCPPTPFVSPLGTIYRNFISLVWILWFNLGDTLKFFCIKPLVIDVNDQRWARGAYVVVIFHL